MDRLIGTVDHTLLAQDATWEDIKLICDDGMKYETASVCIPASYVKRAKEYVGEKLSICTVIGFPNGYSTTATKIFETSDAVNNGADEIDMVINVAKAKEHDYKYIEEEIRMVVGAAGGHTVKVILETCYLSEDEKVACTLAAARAKANFVKTSTGFGTGGALVTDVVTMKANITPDMEVKASGGIKTLEDALTMIKVGATRIGTSSGIAIIEAYNAQEGE